MLDQTKMKLLKLLVALAWADGKVDEEELEIVEAMLDTFEANHEEGAEIREWAKQERSLADIDVSDLTEDDADLVLFQAVLLTYIDGEQTEKEVVLLNEFIEKLGIPSDRAAEVLERANEKAKELLPVLNA
jgi:uncharacterized tellurite resistance protein B-like protein